MFFFSFPFCFPAGWLWIQLLVQKHMERDAWIHTTPSCPKHKGVPRLMGRRLAVRGAGVVWRLVFCLLCPLYNLLYELPDRPCRWINIHEQPQRHLLLKTSVILSSLEEGNSTDSVGVPPGLCRSLRAETRSLLSFPPSKPSHCNLLYSWLKSNIHYANYWQKEIILYPRSAQIYTEFIILQLVWKGFWMLRLFIQFLFLYLMHSWSYN